MAVTPLFKPLRIDGGTFYTFQPAMKDINLMISNPDNIKLNFSKFVCIKLPEWANITKQSLYIDPNKLESLNDNSSNDNANTFFVKSYLQNYAENLNTLFDQYREDDNFSNTAESAFLKSMMSKFNNSTPPLELDEFDTYLDYENVTRNIFRETTDSSIYEQVIQYIGDINLVNNAKKDGNEYVEIFGYIPTNAGKLIDTQFIQNIDLKPLLSQIPENAGEDWIQGQENNYTSSTDKTYAKAVYDTVSKKYNTTSDVDMLKIDWDDLENPESNYKKDNGNFDFNAVLLYYDIFDNGNEGTVSRNLYGVFIIDSFNTTSPVSNFIPTFTKYQPDANQSGNSYSFRFNLAFSNSTNIVTTATVINDYSTYSMELYMHALESLNRIAIDYSKLGQSAIVVHDKIIAIEQIIFSLYEQADSTTALRLVNESISTVNQAIIDLTAIAQSTQENKIERIFVDNEEIDIADKTVYLKGVRIYEFIQNSSKIYKLNDAVYVPNNGIYVSIIDNNENNIPHSSWLQISTKTLSLTENNLLLTTEYPSINVEIGQPQQQFNAAIIEKLTPVIKSIIVIDANTFTWYPHPSNTTWTIQPNDLAKNGWLVLSGAPTFVNTMRYVSGDPVLSSSWLIL